MRARPRPGGGVGGGAHLAAGDRADLGRARGSAEYKRLLARQLLIAHFITLFPDRFTAEPFYAGRLP